MSVHFKSAKYIPDASKECTSLFSLESSHSVSRRPFPCQYAVEKKTYSLCETAVPVQKSNTPPRALQLAGSLSFDACSSFGHKDKHNNKNFFVVLESLFEANYAVTKA